jgi:hypothetical protein
MRRIAMDYDRLASLPRCNSPIRKRLDEKLRTDCSLRARIAAASDCRTIAMDPWEPSERNPITGNDVNIELRQNVMAVTS